MTRVKRGTVTKRRHARLLKETKGYWGQRSNVFKRANETLLRAMAFAYKGRKLEKRTMRGLFITRINAALKQLSELDTQFSLRYNEFIHGLEQTQIMLNRKMLSQLAVYDAAAFAHIAHKVRQANS
jgi:large subunit ribosomal protein L20